MKSANCIDHPPRPELLLKTLGDLERAAVDADVLADQEDALVVLHLLPEAVADRLEVGLLCHVKRGPFCYMWCGWSSSSGSA
jgi:hypothetical protein